MVRQLSLNSDPENNPCSTQPISQKVVKRGFRPAAQPQKCVVSFERYPVWLWSLRPCDWSHIIITETDARRLRQFHMSTCTKFEPKIVAVSSLLSPGNDASVWWISGSHAFGESHRELSSTPTVLWMSDSGCRTPPSILEESWFRLFHANVGDTT